MANQTSGRETSGELDQLSRDLLRLAEQGAVATSDIVHRLNKAVETLVENAVLQGAPVPDLVAGDDPIVQEATPGR